MFFFSSFGNGAAFLCSSLECPSPCNLFHRKPYPWCATFCPSIISIFSLFPICGKDIQQLPYTQTVVHHGHSKACPQKLAVHKTGPKPVREVVSVPCRPQKRPETWTGGSWIAVSSTKRAQNVDGEVGKECGSGCTKDHVLVRFLK